MKSFQNCADEREPQKHHDLPNAGEYWHGRVVSTLSLHKDRRMYGHILGLYRTTHGEVGIRIAWEGGEIGGLHHGNVDLH